MTTEIIVIGRKPPSTTPRERHSMTSMASIDRATIDETILDNFRPDYQGILIRHYSKEFTWTEKLSRLVLRDALRFMTICAIPPTGTEPIAHDKAVAMVCSPIVDQVVDSLLLDTPLLMWLERYILGGARFVHIPAYAHGIINRHLINIRYKFTISLMLAAGYHIDSTIWPDRLPVNYAPCSGCNDADDCLMYAVTE